jgi:protein-L-isoaspartate(D-aspartate) O-methyltransferase
MADPSPAIGPNSSLLTRGLPTEMVRLFYAEDVRFRARLKSQAVAEAFAVVPREDFLGPGPWQVMGLERGYVTTEDADPRHLYHDALVAIDAARKLNNGQPSALAKWIDSLDLRPGERVCHVGCGVGYYTAIMAHVVGPAGRVLAVELDPGLAERARSNLARWNWAEVVSADGTAFDPGDADAIFVNAGVTHPQPLWLDRLRPGGRLLVPITTSNLQGMIPAMCGIGAEGQAGGFGEMLLVHRENDRYPASFVSMVAIFSSPSGRDPELDRALAEVLKQTLRGQRGPVRSLRRDPHTAGDTCWLHGADFCLSTAEAAAPAA